jgi:nicotinamidase-related amidase
MAGRLNRYRFLASLAVGTDPPAGFVAPHRVFGPETNDLVLQLRKRRISHVILGGMLANMCVESNLRELPEQGFEVAVVKDATAAPKHPEWGYGYTAALIN